VYGLDPEVVPIPNVTLEDQLGTTIVNLTNLGKLGVPVSKTIVPEPPSGVVLRPFEHLAWYEFFELQTPSVNTVVTNQFGTSNWFVGDGLFLLVPAIRDGQGSITLDQHWKCYDAFTHSPGVFVNLLTEFGLEPDVEVLEGHYLCNPVDKNAEGPPPFPDEHLACYDIIDLPLLQNHDLDDQFGNHPNLLIEDPELLCVPSLRFVPEPGVLFSLGSGLALLWRLDRRRRRRASGRGAASAR
jgi:hypothetical protein